MLLGVGDEGGVQMEKLVSGSRDVLAVKFELSGLFVWWWWWCIWIQGT